MFKKDISDENLPLDNLKIEDIVLNLKLISKIKQNDKMIIINQILNVDSRLLQSVRRWYTCDNRNDTVQFIENVINTAIDYMNHENKNTVYDIESIKIELKNTIQGLENLSATYKIDNLIISKIDILKEKISKLCN
tara:strand:- start:1817 stop:2224 length:408 start_codon:yes stop_codon:yes gene_type:complete